MTYISFILVTNAYEIWNVQEIILTIPIYNVEALGHNFLSIGVIYVFQINQTSRKYLEQPILYFIYNRCRLFIVSKSKKAIRKCVNICKNNSIISINFALKCAFD